VAIPHNSHKKEQFVMRTTSRASMLMVVTLSALTVTGEIRAQVTLGSVPASIPPPVVSASVAAPVASIPQPIRYRTADCHLHLVDFLQRTDGARAVIAAMDRSGVDHAVISGMPLVKQWSQDEPSQPQYYLEDDARCYWYSATDVLVAREVLSLPPQERARLHPIICGFNAADRNAIDHIQRMIEWYPGFWQGIGEVMARHDDLTSLTYGETSRANNLALDRIYAFAATHDLPVWVHSNISSVWKREPIYLNEMEEAVRRHPKTRFIWCHAGISRRIVVPTLTTELRRLLAAYPNLFIDLSWVVYETYLLKDGQPNREWVALIEAFPNRFMIGSDKVGRFGNYHEEMQKYYIFLDALKPDTARRVASANLLSVLPKTPAMPAQTSVTTIATPINK
jgi:hypothetical protein